MSFDSLDPDLEDAVQELIALEDVSDVTGRLTESILNRRLSVQMRSLNLLLNHPEYRERAARVIAQMGFPL